MPETSTRILLDRMAIRLDGRPFFAFGPRLMLTGYDRIPAAMEDIASAGFTAVATPPASPGNVAVLRRIFDEAERLGLLVVVVVEPRLPEPAPFLASEFRHRPCLHSYCIPVVSPSLSALEEFCRQRDLLRSLDLFHPIWTPYSPKYPMQRWIQSVDVQSVGQFTGGPFPRERDEDGNRLLGRVLDVCMSQRIPGRPFFCHSFQVSLPDRARELGLYTMDPSVVRTPARMEDWYPYLTNVNEMGRWDFLPPDPDLLRVRAFEMLAARVRGILFDSYEFLLGPAPTTGRDRFHELAVLAQEIAVCRDFFADGQLVRIDVESGHPRLRAALLQHSEDVLILVWRAAQGDEFWVDPSRINRVEVSLAISPDFPVQAWQIDFPRARPVNVARDRKGAIRLQLDRFDLSAKVLVARARQRPKELANALAERVPLATDHLLQGLEVRLEKITRIESDLRALGAGQRQDKFLTEIRKHTAEVRHFCEAQDWDHAWEMAMEAQQQIRSLINRQMVSAIGTADLEPDSLLNHLRHNYYTLPFFYRETSIRDNRSIQEYT